MLRSNRPLSLLSGRSAPFTYYVKVRWYGARLEALRYGQAENSEAALKGLNQYQAGMPIRGLGW